MKPRLALLSHVDWGHIRQRPHHLAAGLAAHFDVTVLAPLARRRAGLVPNATKGVRLAHVVRLPGSYRRPGVARANAVLARWQCAPRLRGAAAVVVTSPELWPWIERDVGHRPLVYDCMDDALAFDQDDGVRALKARWERALLARADLVVCSSDELATRMKARGAAPQRLRLIPNGWDEEAFPLSSSQALPATDDLELAYFGTIAPWLDVDALRAMLAASPRARLRLIGPVDGMPPSGLDRTSIEPPWPHEALAAAVAGAHVLLLPFRVDDLTRAVDPVKLYEYIALGKPILASHWPALDRFAPFVTFYRDAAHAAELVHARALPPPPDTAARRAFLAAQSWQARADAFAEAIDGAGRDRFSRA